MFKQIFGFKLTDIVIFTHLEVVGCGSQTQLQVGENLNSIIYRFRGYYSLTGHVMQQFVFDQK